MPALITLMRILRINYSSEASLNIANSFWNNNKNFKKKKIDNRTTSHWFTRHQTKQAICIIYDYWKCNDCKYMIFQDGTPLLYDIKLLEESYQVHHQRHLFLFKICLTQWEKNLPSWMQSMKNYSLKWYMQLKVKNKTWSKSKKF